MKIQPITNYNSTNKNNSFKGNLIYDELNLLPKQIKEIETVAKNFNLSKKPYDISVFNDPRDSFLILVAEDKAKQNKCSMTLNPNKQRALKLDESMANLIAKYDEQFIKPNTFMGKLKKIMDKINPFSK